MFSGVKNIQFIEQAAIDLLLSSESNSQNQSDKFKIKKPLFKLSLNHLGPLYLQIVGFCPKKGLLVSD